MTTLPDNPTTDDYVNYLLGRETRTYRLGFWIDWSALGFKSREEG